MEYTSPSKYHWRRWQWNTISTLLRRLPTRVRVKDALVLYLVGPDDFDRGVAREHGFSDHNLIGIDRDEACVRQLRKASHVGIHDDFMDLIGLWPADWPINVIVADFVSGLDERVSEYFQRVLLLSQAVSPEHTVVSINLQRGRDAFSQPLRETISSTEATRKADPKGYSADIFKDFDKHRGRQFVWNYISRVANLVLPPELHGSREVFRHFFYDMLDAMRPQFHSYRQRRSVPYMDSAAFCPIYKEKPRPQAEFDGAMLDTVEWRNARFKPKLNPRGIIAKIAAARAVRTMRIEGYYDTLK